MAIVDVSSFLADSAVYDINGRVAALGAGWAVTGPAPLPGFALAVFVRTTSNHGGIPLTVGVRLLNSAGEGVYLGVGPNPFEVTHQALPGNPAESPPDLEGGVTLVMQLPAGIALDPGQYRFEFSIDGLTQPTWYREFYVREKPGEYESTPKLTTVVERSPA